MPSWIWIALYLFIGGVVAMSFIKKNEEPDYGFVTVIMLFWPIVVLVFFCAMFVFILNLFKGK